MLTVSGVSDKIPGSTGKAFWASCSETVFRAPSVIHNAHAQTLFTVAYQPGLKDCAL